jgi:hypothetical protein
MVYLNTFVPKDMLLTVGDEVVSAEIVPPPDTVLQRAVAGALKVLPLSVVVFEDEQIETSFPAFAVNWLLSKTTILIWSAVVAGKHGPLEMVHCKMFVPKPKPLTAEFGEVLLDILALPCTIVH